MDRCPHELFKEISENINLRRKWIALRPFIDAMNTYYNLSGDKAITQRKFKKKIVNNFIYDDKLYFHTADKNPTGIFMHTAQTQDQEDLPGKQGKTKQLFIFITTKGEAPPVFTHQREWINESCFCRVRVKHGGGLEDFPLEPTQPTLPTPGVKSENDSNRIIILPWESTEYRNFFGCVENEHPLDTIALLLKIINYCKCGILKHRVLHY